MKNLWLVLFIVLSAVVPTFAQAHQTRQRTFDAPPEVLFKAASKVARTHYVVTDVNENERLITFHTEQHNCTGNIEPEGPNKSTLFLNIQNVLPGFTYASRMTCEANKFFDYVQEELKKGK
ncbi:MAG: hypothetical protein ABSF71_39365 [Terriglobia bacterium]